MSELSLTMLCSFAVLGYCRVFWGDENKVDLTKESLASFVIIRFRRLLQGLRRILQYKQA